jgi:hypothetical protein
MLAVTFRSVSGSKPGRPQKKSSYTLADTDPNILKHFEEFPGHMQSVVVKTGNATSIDVYPAQPFVFRLKKGTDPLDTLLEKEVAEFCKDQYKSFKVASALCRNHTSSTEHALVVQCMHVCIHGMGHVSRCSHIITDCYLSYECRLVSMHTRREKALSS